MAYNPGYPHIYRDHATDYCHFQNYTKSTQLVKADMKEIYLFKILSDLVAGEYYTGSPYPLPNIEGIYQFMKICQVGERTNEICDAEEGLADP